MVNLYSLNTYIDKKKNQNDKSKSNLGLMPYGIIGQ